MMAHIPSNHNGASLSRDNGLSDWAMGLLELSYANAFFFCLRACRAQSELN